MASRNSNSSVTYSRSMRAMSSERAERPVSVSKSAISVVRVVAVSRSGSVLRDWTTS